MSSHKTPSRSKKTTFLVHSLQAPPSVLEITGSHLLNTVVLFETGKGQHLHVFFFCYFYRKIEKPDTRNVTNIQPFYYTLFYIINTLFSYLSLLLMILTHCYNHLRA